jgi:hypothetical protein
VKLFYIDPTVQHRLTSVAVSAFRGGRVSLVLSAQLFDGLGGGGGVAMSSILAPYLSTYDGIGPDGTRISRLVTPRRQSARRHTR